MQYRLDQRGRPLSILGFGCMRFPRAGGKIDLEKTQQLIVEAVEGGVNYFDTAYIYGGSEAALGEILSRTGLRDRVNIATKLPHYLLHRPADLERVFQEELRRLKTDHIDYYLMHMLNDAAAWEKLRALGIEDWLEEKRRAGQIGQAGFSHHGNTESFREVVDAYAWNFCQIQYNYMDEHTQAGREGLRYAAKKGLPVIIMEPLRGGKLAGHLPQKALRLFAEHPIQASPAEWSFRWLWDQPEVTCVLSGMTTREILRENLAAAHSAQAGAMGEEEQALLRAVAAAIRETMKVGCTGCAYCMPCPRHVDIPGTFTAYNLRYTEGKGKALAEHIKTTAARRQSTAAANCIQCGKCEQHCPQGLAIRQELKNARRELEGPLYQTARFFIRALRAY